MSNKYIDILEYIPKEKIIYFLIKIAKLISYPIDELDIDTVNEGISDLNCNKDCFKYCFTSNDEINFAICINGGSDNYKVKIKSNHLISERILAISKISHVSNSDLNYFKSIVLDEFKSFIYPGDENIVFCSGDECEDCEDFFIGKNWNELINKNLPLGYAGPSFLSKSARKYYFPAYLIKAFESKDKWYLEYSLDDSEFKELNTMQKELVLYVKENI